MRRSHRRQNWRQRYAAYAHTGRAEHPPPHGTLQTVVEIVVPQGAFKDPPAEGAFAVSGRHCTAHVSHEKYPTGVGMDCPCPNSKRDHQHTGHQPARDPVEGGGGADRHPSVSNPPNAQRLTWVQVRKRDGESYNGVETCSIACEHRPITPLPILPGIKEGL